MHLDDELDQELEAEYRHWLRLVHEEQSSSEDEGEQAEAYDIEAVDHENSETEYEKASSDIEFEETEEWQGIVNSEEDEEEWAGLETDQSQGSDGNIEAETMGEDLAKGLHVIWKHWQGHFDKSLKYYTKIERIEDSEVQDKESLS